MLAGEISEAAAAAPSELLGRASSLTSFAGDFCTDCFSQSYRGNSSNPVSAATSLSRENDPQDNSFSCPWDQQLTAQVATAPPRSEVGVKRRFLRTKKLKKI